MENVKEKKRSFLYDLVCGVAIGVAFIIPGFSGGSIAAILGIYERLVSAIADIFKSFKKSFMTLLPIGIGMVIGVVALLFPLGWALEYYPLPTVSLFVGLALGGLPSITDKLEKKPSFANITAFILPFLVAVAMSFLPISSDVNLLGADPFGFVLLFLVGIIGSAALVVPGISGSMILLILGYYNPIVSLITNHLLIGKDVLKSVLVLGTVALGIVLGFFLISIMMKWLLQKHPGATYAAILGFVIGSIPTIYISTAKESGITLDTLPTSPIHWIACVLLLIMGAVLSLSLVLYSRKKNKQKAHNTENESGTEACD